MVRGGARWDGDGAGWAGCSAVGQAFLGKMDARRLVWMRGGWYGYAALNALGTIHRTKRQQGRA